MKSFYIVTDTDGDKLVLRTEAITFVNSHVYMDNKGGKFEGCRVHLLHSDKECLNLRMTLSDFVKMLES